MSDSSSRSLERSWLSLDVTLCRDHAEVLHKREQYEQFIRMLADQGLVTTDSL